MKNKFLKMSFISLIALCGCLSVSTFSVNNAKIAIAEPPAYDYDEIHYTYEISLKYPSKQYFAGDEISCSDFKFIEIETSYYGEEKGRNEIFFDSKAPYSFVGDSYQEPEPTNTCAFFFTNYEDKINAYISKNPRTTLETIKAWQLYEIFGSEMLQNSNNGFKYKLKEGDNKIFIKLGTNTMTLHQEACAVLTIKDVLPAAIKDFEALNTNASLGLSYTGDGTTENPFVYETAFLRFGIDGSSFSKDLYEGLKAANGNTVPTFGVEVVKGEGLANEIVCSTVASLDKDGNLTTVAGDIANYQYFLVIKNIPVEAISIVFHCRAYVVINETKYYAKVKEHSVATAANFYVTDKNMKENETVKANLGYLNWLIAQASK